MLRRIVLALVLLTTALAGCVQPASDSVDDASAGTAAAIADPFIVSADHDHKDHAQHTSSIGFERTFHHPLAGSPTHTAGAHVLDVKGGYLFAGVYSEHDREGGFFIFDVTKDPAQPELVGRYQHHFGPLGGDRSMEATEDAEFVVLGTEAVTCAGHVNPYGPGLYLIDVRDKANPMVTSYFPDQGIHSVGIHRIGDVDYVFTVGAGTFMIDKSLPLPQLTQVHDLVISHDMIIQDDPVLGKPVLYAADGSGPLSIYDVSEPANPKLLAKWNIPDREDGQYYVHTAAAGFIDDRRIVVVTSEDWEDYASPMWVLDATDFELVDTLAQWQNPGNHSADGLRFSLHNPRLDGDRLYFAHYHGGLWGMDLSDPAKPTPIQHWDAVEDTGFTPAPTSTSFVSDELCGSFNLADAVGVFDVEVHEGVVYAADLHTGLYALKPTV